MGQLRLETHVLPHVCLLKLNNWCCTQLPAPFEATSGSRKEKDTLLALSEYVDALSRAPIGGAVNAADGTGAEPHAYLMNFSINQIYRFGPDWKKVYAFNYHLAQHDDAYFFLEHSRDE